MSTREEQPATFEEAAASLAGAAAEGVPVRLRGAGTKLGWGVPTEGPAIELGTGSLQRIVEHNAGDLTAVLEAGVPLLHAQQVFSRAGQMLALDPPLGRGAELGATIGGVIAAADAGPLRHRYGGPRDLVLGITVALSDGTIARSGGKVIKNVAGYEIAKLFAGSHGTLGLILSVSVRLHPLPAASATALGATDDPTTLGNAARMLASAPLELDALDVAWRSGRGGLLARAAGVTPAPRAERAARLMREAGLEHVEVTDRDQDLWARQRAGQRSRSRALVRVAALPSALAQVLRAADKCGGTLVGRAALGASFIELDPDAVSRLRQQLPARSFAVLLDAPAELRASIDPWGAREDPALDLMRRVKHRFDPAGVCNPGGYVGGI